MKMEQSVPKRRHIKFRRRGITQNKTQNIQTIDHLILQCERLKYKRGMLKNSVLKAGNWPISKGELTNKNLKQFIRYINSMDLEKLNHSNEEL
jgi:ABC-type enterochelin transport system ATPase subunit